MKEHKYLNNNNPRKKTVRKFRFIGTLREVRLHLHCKLDYISSLNPQSKTYMVRVKSLACGKGNS